MEAEEKPGRLTGLAHSAGTVAATLWVSAGVFWGAVAYTANEDTAFQVDPNTERLVGEMAYLLFVTGIFSALPLVLATSLVARRTGVLPLACLARPARRGDHARRARSPPSSSFSGGRCS